MTTVSEAPSSILVVDDSPESLTVLRLLLTKRGHRVRPALNGEMALKAIGKSLPDLILLDIMMPPGEDGYEICRKLKSDDRTRDIPVLFVSALGKTEDRIKAFQAGGVDYIGKPFHTEEVLARVETHLALQNARRQLHEQNMRLQQEIGERERAQQALQQQNRDLATLNEELAAAKDRLQSVNSELQSALAKVKKLKGLLPICSSCHKIRDDKGYWQQIETYISTHSEADFTHSICPDCTRKLYPDLDLDLDQIE